MCPSTFWFCLGFCKFGSFKAPETFIFWFVTRNAKKDKWKLRNGKRENEKKKGVKKKTQTLYFIQQKSINDSVKNNF